MSTDADDINELFRQAAAEDKRSGVIGSENVPRRKGKDRLYHANVELEKLANRKPEPDFAEIANAKRAPKDSDPIQMSRVCTACGGQKRIATHPFDDQWEMCSKCDGEGLEHYTKTRGQLRAEGMEICEYCGDIYDVEDYCRQCELRAQERQLGVQ